MTEIDLKRVKKISQKYKDITYGYLRRMQKMFPNDNPYFTIDQLIQDLCLLYFTKSIVTKILTHDEQIKLYEMVDDHTNHKFDDWELLFRGTRDGYKPEDFHKKCDDKNNTICVIESPDGNVFGGFTSLIWNVTDTNQQYKTDPSAFVYLIRSNQGYDAQIFPVQNDGGEQSNFILIFIYHLGVMVQPFMFWVIHINIQRQHLHQD